MLSRLPLRTRIAMVSIPTTLLALACTMFLCIDSYLALAKMKLITEELVNQSFSRSSQGAEFRATLLKSSVTLRDIALSHSDAERLKFVERRSKAVGEMAGLLKDLAKGTSPGEDQVVKDLDKLMVEFGAAVETFDSLWKGKVGANEAASGEIRRAMAEGIWNLAVPLRNKIEDKIMAFGDLERKHQASIAASADDLYSHMRSRLVFMGTLSLALTIASAIAIVGYMSQISKRLGRITRALNRSFSSVEKSSHSIASSSSHLAASTTEEASSIAETAAAMEQMTATIAKTVQNVATTLEVAEEGQHEAKRGREVVGKMLSAMNEIQTANAKLETMVKLIEEIKDKTRVINDIVFETRLLSFNASIEAARAGAQGRGFAVVAEEVGNLAVVSGKAADEIRVLLESSTSQVNEIVRSTQERVDLGRARAEECEKAFGGMGESLSRVCQYVRGISAAAQEQDSGVKQINRAMAQLDAVTQTNATEAEGLNGEASHLSDESIVMADSVRQLFATVLGREDEADTVEGEDEREPARKSPRERGQGSRKSKQARPARDFRNAQEDENRHHADPATQKRPTTQASTQEHSDLDVPLRDDPHWRAS